MRAVLALLLAMMLCLLLDTPVFATDDNGQSTPDLAGGVVTGLTMDRFLNFKPQNFRLGEPVGLSGDIALVEQSLQCSVLLDKVVYSSICTAAWNIDELDFALPGDYQVVGRLLPPTGCSFADGVRQQVIIPIRILPEGKQKVTRIHDYESLICGIMLPLGHAAKLEQASNERRNLIVQTGTGVTEADESVVLVPEAFDDSGVDMNTAGEYFITVQLRPEDEESYTIDEGLRTLKIPVCVSAPEDFDIWVAVINRGTFVVHYLTTLDEAPTTWWMSDDAALTPDALRSAFWSECAAPVVQMTGAQEFAIQRSELILNRHYYFRLKAGARFSGILHIVDDGTTVSYGYYLDGDRDGGDGDNDGFKPPLITQPAPAPDDEKDDIDNDNNMTVGSPHQPSVDLASTPTPTHKPIPRPQTPASVANTPAFTESFDETTDVISGARLRALRDTGKVRFSKQGVMVLLSDTAMDELTFEDSDLFIMELRRQSADSFSFLLQQNDKPLVDLPDTQVMLPFTPKADSSVLTLQNAQGVVIGEGSFEAGIATFVIDTPGEYLIVDTAADMPDCSLPPAYTTGEPTDLASNTTYLAHIPTAVVVLLSTVLCAWYLFYRKGGQHG